MKVPVEEAHVQILRMLRGFHTSLYWGYIGIMEKKMETTWASGLGFVVRLKVYDWGYIGIMEKKMETTI